MIQIILTCGRVDFFIKWRQIFGQVIFLRLEKFFWENLSEIIGAYFDGEKIFVVRLTEKFETLEIDADASEIEHIAEKISE